MQPPLKTKGMSVPFLFYCMQLISCALAAGNDERNPELCIHMEQYLQCTLFSQISLPFHLNV